MKKTAKILNDSVREEDIVARWAGDEFIIFLPQTVKSEAKKMKKLFNKADQEMHKNKEKSDE